MTRRRWIAERWDEATATLSGATADHLIRVLRAQRGMIADVIAGGKVFRSELVAIESSADGKSEARFSLIAELTTEPALPITLVMSVYKFDHMEWAIEKATELGVAAIAPAAKYPVSFIYFFPSKTQIFRNCTGIPCSCN